MAIEFEGTWKEIWTQKGAVDGGKEVALELGGWNRTITPANDIVKNLVDFMDIKKDDKVLEIGCGAGGMAQYLDCDYIGIDYSPTSVKRCMEFWNKCAICSEANDLPFKDNYFDKVFAYGCFMYFENWDYVKQVVKEMRRVSKGMIFIGELPMESHEVKHLLFSKEEFETMGFEIMKGWAEPYQDVRFSAFDRR